MRGFLGNNRQLTSFLLLTLVAVGQVGCLFFRGQRYYHFQTPTPVPAQSCLVLGFLGGREPWDSTTSSVRKLALELRDLGLDGLHVETVENKKRKLALQLIRNALDANRDGTLDARERRSVGIILYGQSFGGAAVVKLARQLEQLGIPVSLTVQIDSVGLGDEVIPANVRRAANLFQCNGWIIRGEPKIRAADPQRTVILGNFRFDYRKRKIDISGVPWYKKIFRVAHTRMNYDPEVWVKVKELILQAVQEDCPSVAGSVSSRWKQSERLGEKLPQAIAGFCMGERRTAPFYAGKKTPVPECVRGMGNTMNGGPGEVSPPDQPPRSQPLHLRPPERPKKD